MKKLLLPLALAALALCGCDGIFYSRHDVPSPVLLLTPQWHGQEPTAEGLEVTVTGTDPGGLEPRTLTLAAGGTARVEVPQGTYRITATHGAEGVALAGTHFTLTPGADGLLPEPPPSVRQSPPPPCRRAASMPWRSPCSPTRASSASASTSPRRQPPW